MTTRHPLIHAFLELSAAATMALAMLVAGVPPAFASTGGAPQASKQEKPCAPDRVIVKSKRGVAAQARSGVLASLGLESKRELRAARAQLLRVSKSTRSVRGS